MFMEDSNIKKGQAIPTICVVLAAVLWGTIGIFTKALTQAGLSSMQITAIRCLTIAILVGLVLLLKDKNSFKISLKDIAWFLLNGLCSIFVFYTAYQNAILMTSMSTAVVLLYTAPAVVAVLSAIIFKEKMTGKRIISVIMCVIGSALVSGIMNGFGGSGLGIMFGILSSVGYALYSIFSKIILKKYSTLTNVFYSFMIAGIAAFIMGHGTAAVKIMFSSVNTLLWALSCGILTGFVSYVAYTFALTRMLASKASIIAAIEPVVAILLGVFLYKESLTLAGVIGIIMVLTAIVLQSIKGEEKDS